MPKVNYEYKVTLENGNVAIAIPFGFPPTETDVLSKALKEAVAYRIDSLCKAQYALGGWDDDDLSSWTNDANNYISTRINRIVDAVTGLLAMEAVNYGSLKDEPVSGSEMETINRVTEKLLKRRLWARRPGGDQRSEWPDGRLVNFLDHYETAKGRGLPWESALKVAAKEVGADDNTNLRKILTRARKLQNVKRDADKFAESAHAA